MAWVLCLMEPSSFSFSGQNMSNNWSIYTQQTTTVEMKVVTFIFLPHQTLLFCEIISPEGIQSSRQYSGQSPASHTDLRMEASSLFARCYMATIGILVFIWTVLSGFRRANNICICFSLRGRCSPGPLPVNRRALQTFAARGPLHQRGQHSVRLRHPAGRHRLPAISD